MPVPLPPPGVQAKLVDMVKVAADAERKLRREPEQKRKGAISEFEKALVAEAME